MKRFNWWLILLIIFCVAWFVVLPVMQLAIGIINRDGIRQLKHRPHITVWTYLTPQDIALLRAEGARPVILKGVAYLDEIDVFAEDTTLAEEGGNDDKAAE